MRFSAALVAFWPPHLEDARVLQEEVPLLREEETEPRDVGTYHASCVITRRVLIIEDL